MITNLTAVVLAGGKSSRMGRNKAFLPFEKRTLIEKVLAELSAAFSRVYISAADDAPYLKFGFPIVLDHYREIGPVGGITSVLESGEKRIFCVGCDMPFLNRPFIEELCSHTAHAAVIPVWQDRAEVLHAIYSDALLPDLKLAISQGEYKITKALTAADIELIPESVTRQFDEAGRCFLNLNTPADYDRIAHYK